MAGATELQTRDVGLCSTRRAVAGSNLLSPLQRAKQSPSPSQRWNLLATKIRCPDLLRSPTTDIQMDNFRGLLSNLNLPLVDNFRQLQPLFGRRVFVRITSKNPKFKKTKLHYSKWDWVGHKKAENDVVDFDE